MLNPKVAISGLFVIISSCYNYTFYATVAKQQRPNQPNRVLQLKKLWTWFSRHETNSDNIFVCNQGNCTTKEKELQQDVILCAEHLQEN